MKKQKRIPGIRIALFLCIVSLAGILAGCSSNSGTNSHTGNEASEQKVQIVTTLFPQYDFARQVAGDHAEIQLLLPLGTDSHSYEPTPADIVAIQEADLFIYTGEYMEGWANTILESLDQSELTVVDVSQGIPLDEEEGHDGHDHAEGAAHSYDPHIWTNPVYAKTMVQTITDALCRVDPDNQADYEQNAQTYQEELSALDEEIREVVATSERKTAFFGSRFALHYFFKEYGLEHVSAYDNCSTEGEPSVAVMSDMIAQMQEQSIPVVYYAELEDPKIARTIQEETGAEMLLFHSCHNIGAEEMEQGVTYLDLMKQNVENLKKGLN